MQSLIIDDHDGFCGLIGEVMKQIGWKCDAANSPYSGITYCKEKRYDLVLVDYWLPGMLGDEVVRQVSGGGHRCIILVSGSPVLTQAEARAAGAAGIIAKPVSLRRLIQFCSILAQDPQYTASSLPPELTPCTSGLAPG